MRSVLAWNGTRSFLENEYSHKIRNTPVRPIRPDKVERLAKRETNHDPLSPLVVSLSLTGPVASPLTVVAVRRLGPAAVPAAWRPMLGPHSLVVKAPRGGPRPARLDGCQKPGEAAARGWPGATYGGPSARRRRPGTRRGGGSGQEAARKGVCGSNRVAAAEIRRGSGGIWSHLILPVQFAYFISDLGLVPL